MAVTKKPSAATQALIDQAVKDALAQASTEATKGLVTAASKPDQIGNLTKTWRKSAEHVAAQVERFVILTVLAAIPSVANLISGGKFDWQTLLAFIAPFAYTAYRQVVPQLNAGRVDSAPGATIVPDQVSTQVVDVPVDNATVQVATPTPDAPATVDTPVAAPEGDAAP